MQENETIHKRIRLLVETFGNNKNTVFACLIDSSEANIRGYIKGVLPKQDILERIVRKLDISAEWLLTGRGEMLKSGTLQPVELEQFALTPVEIIELATKFGEQINENKHLQEKNARLVEENNALKIENERLKN